MSSVKYKSNCKACQLSKRDPKARARIRQATFRREDGDETLADIAKEFNISQGPMYNHAKKHIHDTEPIMGARKELRVAKQTLEFKAKVQKEAELVLEADVVDEFESRPAEIVALDDYIAQGATMIKEGKLNMTPRSFLGAVKIKTDWAAKQQNNKLELMRTIAAFASGAKKKIDVKEGEIVDDPDTAPEPSDGPDRGSDEAASIYRKAFGHVPAQRPEEVSA